jgi:hypothetical protein
MRSGPIACCLLLCSIGSCPADEPLLPDRNTLIVLPAIDPILREASELALKQGGRQRFWTERVILRIGELQSQAGDFGGALRSIEGSGYSYGRNGGLVQLAKSMARDGKRERAFEIVRLLGTDHGWRQDYIEDGVQLRWIEYLVQSRDLALASKAVQKMKSDRYRPDAIRRLAVAYADSGDAIRCSEQFKLALDAAKRLSDDWDRAQVFWQIADAQLSAGQSDAASATIRDLTESAGLKDPWARFSALRECAVIAAKAKNVEVSRRLFRQAIEAQKSVDGLNKSNALEQTAVSQAEAGYIEDALITAAMIKEDGARDRATLAVALAQLRANDAKSAAQTALTIRAYVQYRDDALEAIVSRCIAKEELKMALTMADKFDNSSRKAVAILRVATAHAKSGNRRTATEIAARIVLTPQDPLLGAGRDRFDYRTPSTWVVCYDASSAFTMSSHRAAVTLGAEVAGAAMTLSQALGQRFEKPFEVLFGGINYAEIIQSLARSHAASGDANEALGWARKIGRSGDAEQSKRDEQRIHALVGVAEGIHERSVGGMK